MGLRAVIFGCEGPELTPRERAFFAEAEPWGFVLFARNIETPDQLRRLTGDLRACLGREAPILVDQEGGRVARLRGPHWREWQPALEQCRALPDPGLRARAMRLRYRLIAAELRAVGIDMNAAPVLDVVGPATHPIILSRAYSEDPAEVAGIGRAVAEGLLEGGVLPVMKHAPGQGRAARDSHLALPVVDAPRAALAALDFAPFRALKDLPVAMTAHVVYSAIDTQAPGTLSARVIGAIRGEIGFEGLLLTDDLSMQALSGPFAERAARALAAGCDILLHCNGDPGEMLALAEAAPLLAGAAAARAERALARRTGGAAEPAEHLAAEFAAIAGRAAHA
jgi:beta-N-acetylhexosaminidase